MAETAARLSGRGPPAPCAGGFLAPILCVSAVQLALTIGFICYSQSQWLQKNPSGISEEFLQCLRLISQFNSSTPNLSETETQKMSKSCSQALQGVKQLVKQVMPPTPNRSGHKGQLSSRTRKISQRMAPYAHLTIKRPTQSSTALRPNIEGPCGTYHRGAHNPCRGSTSELQPREPAEFNIEELPGYGPTSGAPSRRSFDHPDAGASTFS